MKYSASTSTPESVKPKQEELENSVPANTEYSQIDVSKLSEMMQRYVEVKQKIFSCSFTISSR